MINWKNFFTINVLFDITWPANWRAGGCHIKIAYFSFCFYSRGSNFTFHSNTLSPYGELFVYTCFATPFKYLSSLDLVIASSCTLVWTWQSSEKAVNILISLFFIPNLNVISLSLYPWQIAVKNTNGQASLR